MNTPAYLPVGALPDSALQTRLTLPADSLREHVAAYFSVSLTAGDPPAAVRTLPDGCSDLMFDLGGEPHAWLRGPRTRATRYEHRKPTMMFGVQLLPGAVHVLTGLPARALTDKWQPLPELMEAAEPAGAAAAHQLVADLRATDAFATRTDLLNSYLERRLGNRPIDRRIVRAMRAVTTPEHCSVAGIATLCATSERNLVRLFNRWVGVGPKRLSLILRFQRVLDAMSHGQAPQWASLAQELGYSDQPHLIRDFAAYAGMAPALLMSTSTEGRTAGFKT